MHDIFFSKQLYTHQRDHMSEILGSTEKMEKEYLIIDENSLVEEVRSVHGVSFPSVWISKIKTIYRVLKPKERIIEQHLFGIFLQVIVMLTTYIPSIVIGALFFNERNETNIFCILLILQGLCGVFIVFIYLRTVIFESTEQCQRTIMLANFATVLRFIWFISIQIWLFEQNGSYDFGTLYLLILLIVMSEYIIRISFLCFRRWDCLLTSSWLEKKIQERYKLNRNQEKTKEFIQNSF